MLEIDYLVQNKCMNNAKAIATPNSCVSSYRFSIMICPTTKKTQIPIFFLGFLGFVANSVDKA